MKQSELARLYREYHEAKQAAAKVKTLSDQIKRAINYSHEPVKADKYVAWVTTSKPSMKFDEKTFAVDHPDLYEQYKKEVPGTPRLYLK